MSSTSYPRSAIRRTCSADWCTGNPARRTRPRYRTPRAEDGRSIGGAPASRATPTAGQRGDLGVSTRAPRAASLIGAPTDVGASHRGASMGPEALRVAGLHGALTGCGLQVIDCGNVSGPPNPGLPPQGRVSQSRRSGGLESRSARRRVSGARLEPAADSVGRRSQPEHRLGFGRGSPLPRGQAAAADHLAGCARRFQHARIEPERLIARHAGLGVVRVRPKRAGADRRRSARHQSRSGCARSGFAASIRASAGSCTSSSSRCSTCAISTRWA